MPAAERVVRRQLEEVMSYGLTRVAVKCSSPSYLRVGKCT